MQGYGKTGCNFVIVRRSDISVNERNILAGFNYIYFALMTFLHLKDVIMLYTFIRDASTSMHENKFSLTDSCFGKNLLEETYWKGKSIALLHFYFIIL